MSVAMDEFPRRHRITVEEYHRMAELGFFAPDARVELIDGEIIDMPPIGPRHRATVSCLHELLVRAVSDRVLVWGQSGIQLGDFSEPQPDLALLPRRADFYAQKNPVGADTLLIIEVSETTLRYDQRTKSPLYARYGIPEYWIFDTQAKQLYVSRNPTPTGYQQTFTADQPASMPIVALPGVTIDVSSVIAL
jgi:Uma2 family endonuclease